jgi:ribosome-associated toxin RatA of RatAB toxin-antitoxin module
LAPACHALCPSAFFGGARVISAFQRFVLYLASFAAMSGLCLNASVVSAQTPEIQFLATREGEFILAEARVDLPVAQSMAWSVLTDYESYPRFISTMIESRIIERSPFGKIVDQKGSFGFLFFTQAVEVRMLVAELPPSVVVARLVSGSFRDLQGRYELQPIASGTRLSYQGRFLPDFNLPPLIGMSIVHHALQKNFTEMVDEILRREAAAQRERTGKP